jgi:hypothetical protein
MGNLKPGADIIYESPDHGETIYARYAGEQERWLVGQSVNAKNRVDSIKEERLWGEIRRAAKTDPALQDALDRVIIIYELSRENGSIKHKE